ncbi:DNA polymerase beta, variant [Salpingoeca rosetta]|uniref:DNA polymerase n=1 Tax=Salpingoeca rosetta (strain ATCC 50818 / BSB-021) TaxID=946362 RepID=F2U5R7_SALR5|nr:DNA polymerase beta, variant [Salpingoeca rosetta]EGD82857.1 DNA polymerase beta, variant [Salpingoeca rosetta]|eukprot:XP_004995221.1 DNA polymerase beta, variant [Salpingoeca rosetta]
MQRRALMLWSLFELQRSIASVVGFGPAAARKFVDQGVTTLEELAKQSGLTSTQRIGLKHHHDFEERIPRDEVDRLRKQAFAIISEVDPKLTAEVCGSYRRGASSSGDIDILMTHPEFTSEHKDEKGKITKPRFAGLLAKVVAAMQKHKFVTDSLSCGQTKFMGVCRDREAPKAGEGKYRRIDVRFWPADQYPLALLYFTGSDELNKDMRRKAIDLGFHLNEYAIRPMGEKGTMGDALPVTCEKDVFDYLDMKYLEPSER